MYITKNIVIYVQRSNSISIDFYIILSIKCKIITSIILFNIYYVGHIYIACEFIFLVIDSIKEIHI